MTRKYSTFSTGTTLRGAVGLLTLALIAGCSSLAPKPGFDQVRKEVGARIGQNVHWRSGAGDDQAVAAKVGDLLSVPLSADAAVQIALLNNQGLQARYEQLGVAQATLVQAGLLRNPVFNAALRFPKAGGIVDLDLDVAADFLGVFTRSLRMRLAAHEFEQARLAVTADVLSLAGRVAVAYYGVQSHEQATVMLARQVASTGAALLGAERLFAAGNINQLAVDRVRMLDGEMRLGLADQRTALSAARQTLQRLLGLGDDQRSWVLPGGSPHLPEAVDTTSAVRRSVNSSLELAIAGERIAKLGEQLGLAKKTALIPELTLGASSQRDFSGWGTGPAIGFRIPLFDTGQARRAGLAAALRGAQHSYRAQAMNIAASARLAALELAAARARVRILRDELLPLSQRIVNGQMLAYNAMQADLLQLLRAQRRQVALRAELMNGLGRYWKARVRLETLFSGVRTHFEE